MKASCTAASGAQGRQHAHGRATRCRKEQSATIGLHVDYAPRERLQRAVRDHVHRMTSIWAAGRRFQRTEKLP